MKVIEESQRHML